jgi:hypothetical protein
LSRQQGHPVALSLASAHPELAAAEVQVLDPQLETLLKPQPRSVEQQAHQAGRAPQRPQHRTYLIPGEHHGQPAGLFGPHDPLPAAHVALQYLAKQE